MNAPACRLGAVKLGLVVSILAGKSRETKLHGAWCVYLRGFPKLSCSNVENARNCNSLSTVLRKI